MSDFDDLATRISKLVNEQPNDGRERAMTVTVGGDNHGAITFGNHITINAAAPELKEERPLTDEELCLLAKREKKVLHQAKMRRVFNLPFMLSILALIGYATTMLLQLISSPWQIPQSQHPWLYPLIFALVLLPLLAWAKRLAQLEEPIIREAEETLEQIRQEQHRRRVM